MRQESRKRRCSTVWGCSVVAAAAEEPDDKPGSCKLLLLLNGLWANVALDVVPDGLFFAPVDFGGAALIPIAPIGRNPASR